MKINHKSLAIACASGSFKGAFAHGVLSALESAGIRASAYAAASASVLPAAWATIGQATELGVDYWLAGIRVLQEPDIGMSKVVLGGITSFTPPLEKLFAPENPEYVIATSAVITDAAARETQNPTARRLGRRLLVAAGKKDRSWVDEHLQSALFSSKQHLHADNFAQVAYASSRMLHGWDIPAWIDGQPYIDASYTCLCPAIEMVEAGYREVIAIANEPGILYRDMFQLEAISQSYQGANIHIIQPDVDPKELGVNFTDATAAGLRAVYQHGVDKGKEFATVF
ncbi:hypothetical protein [Nostoc sp. TCL26-01]|uniref:hypothetical protein n=1 Tax=Nostoc sp. TCL26-01 TaxID=2576904 RepID=UPI0015BA0388|nr:hypothetical protein [Nostoc sp. TCL26-01]QLE55341.1 hypothetical protein FD725_07325 [Nostoc sp. TCL26-01]